jgi:hypothetical protein
MLDYKTQSQLMDATATIMRAYFRAATNTIAASAGHSWSLWSGMVETGKLGQFHLPQTWWLNASAWPSMADWRFQGALPAHPAKVTTKPAPDKPTSVPPDGGYAAYRSAGGHAAVQVIVPTVEELAEAGTAIALTPVNTMLGVWRAALRH